MHSCHENIFSYLYRVSVQMWDLFRRELINEKVDIWVSDQDLGRSENHSCNLRDYITGIRVRSESTLCTNIMNGELLFPSTLNCKFLAVFKQDSNLNHLRNCVSHGFAVMCRLLVASCTE